MTGGGSLVYGLDKLLQHKTGIDVIIADDAVSAWHWALVLDNLDMLQQRYCQGLRIQLLSRTCEWIRSQIRS